MLNLQDNINKFKFNNKISFINKLVNSFLTSQNREVGGHNQEWENNFLRNVSQKNLKNQNPQLDGEEMGGLLYELKDKLEFENPSIIKPSNYETLFDLFQAIIFWWIYRKRKNSSTIKSRIAIAKRMSEHPIFPINFFDFNPYQITKYLDYRERNEKAGADALNNEWKTIVTFTKAFGLHNELVKWNYTPPKKPKPKVKIVPLPKTVTKLMHFNYSNEPYENALYQYIMTHSFQVGWRMCSEIVIMKTNDVFIDEGYIIIHEDKNDGLPRQIFPLKDIMDNPRRKSFKNWIEIWRPKVENQYSKDFLYLQPNGKPFTKDYLRKILSQLGKQVWPYYHPYISRHFSCIAELIKHKVENGKFDIYDVQEFHGHSDIENTESYTRYAKRYCELAPFNWKKAVLKFHEKLEGENGLNRKNPEKPIFRMETLREKSTDLWGSEHLFSLCFHPIKYGFYGVLGFQILSLKPISFLYISIRFFFYFQPDFTFRSMTDVIRHELILSFLQSLDCDLWGC